jgi:outer membrane protein insertion porin family
VGFGFRLIIPMMGPVPMSFDFGFPLVKEEGDDTQIFSFSMGWTF